jgi:ABC-type dipeptide/oligopeptide/nickel transport system permease subunit
MVGLFLVIALAVLAIGAPWILPHDPIYMEFGDILESPNTTYWFGTDQNGRDLFARIIWGGRVSLQVGLFSMFVAATLGVLAGLAAGYYGRCVDVLIMRIVDAILSPIRETEYVESARAIGASNWRIMIRAVLPNLLSTIIVQLSLGIGFAMLIEASLSFLGLGIQPPTPAWGSMLGEGREYMTTAWWLTTFPGLAIFFAVLSFNFIGDGLREALDPKQRRL